MSASPNQSNSSFPFLFAPFRIRSVELRNRIVFQPHFTALASSAGMPTDNLAAYHAERALGGVALIVTESQAVHPTGKMSARMIHAWDRSVIPGLRKVTDAVHAHGARIFSQLTHGGHTTLERPPHILWAPTQMPEPSSHFSTKAIDAEDIRAVIDGFATSARNAIDAGYDGIEIKVAHDGLLRSFASPYFNRRTDAYGGTFENRMRLSYEVVEAIKKAIGGETPLGVRLCVDEFTSFGYDLEYGLQMAAALESTGCVDYFNSDAGSFSSFWMEIPPAAVAPAVFDRINRALKRASKLPVIAFGRITPPQRGEELLRSGDADLIGWARQLVADPQTPNKLKAGRVDLVRLCISCNDACTYQAAQEKGIRCIHNPSAGREIDFNERTLVPTSKGRRIVVVGGGPAGLKVAEIAARRGHRVTLLERSAELGGQVNLAARQPEHAIIGAVTAHLETQLREHQVEVRCGATATPEMLRGIGADTIVVATGSEPNLPRVGSEHPTRAGSLGLSAAPDIAGLDRPFVVSSDEVMAGAVKPNGKVVVIDGNGHWEAAGTAEFLKDLGCEVELIASHGLVGEDLEGGSRTLFQRRAALKGMRLRTGYALLEIAERRVKLGAVFSSGNDAGRGRYILIPGDEEWIEDVDWVVPVIGRRSRQDLFLELRSSEDFKDVSILRVGDCVAPRLIQSVIMEAFDVGRSL